jgi:phosphate transport system permease protein
MVFPFRRDTLRALPYPTRSSWGDLLFRAGSGAAGFAILVLLALIAVVLTINALPSFRAFGPGFLASTAWNPVKDEFGALPFIYGTLVTSAIALLLGVPISLGIAIFVAELSPGSIRVPLTYVVELLAAVPSVVYGLWGIFVLVPLMTAYASPALQATFGFLPLFQGQIYGTNLLTAGVILAIMIIPTVSAVSRDALLAVPQHQREAALSLGATRWESIRIAVLSYARSGIFGAVMLGLGRAFGETMAVTMVIGNRNAISVSLFAPAQTLSSLIANSAREGIAGSLELGAIVELGLVLMLVALLINVFARLMVWRFLGKQEGALE